MSVILLYSSFSFSLPGWWENCLKHLKVGHHGTCSCMASFPGHTQSNRHAHWPDASHEYLFGAEATNTCEWIFKGRPSMWGTIRPQRCVHSALRQCADMQVPWVRWYNILFRLCFWYIISICFEGWRLSVRLLSLSSWQTEPSSLQPREYDLDHSTDTDRALAEFGSN